MTDWGAGHQHRRHLLDSSFWNAAGMIAAIPNNPQLVYHVPAKFMSNATIQRIGAIETEHNNPWKTPALFCRAQVYSGSHHPPGAQGELSVNPERLNLEEPPTHELDWTGAQPGQPGLNLLWEPGLPFHGHGGSPSSQLQTRALPAPSKDQSPLVRLSSALLRHLLVEWRCTLILLTWLVKSR